MNTSQICIRVLVYRTGNSDSPSTYSVPSITALASAELIVWASGAPLRLRLISAVTPPSLASPNHTHRYGTLFESTRATTSPRTTPCDWRARATRFAYSFTWEGKDAGGGQEAGQKSGRDTEKAFRVAPQRFLCVCNSE